MDKILKNERILARLYSRENNTFNTINEEMPYFEFRCRIVSKASIENNKVSDTALGRVVSLVLHATDCFCIINERDKIKVNGGTYLVSKVEYLYNELKNLMSSDYDDEFLKKIAPKEIYVQ